MSFQSVRPFFRARLKAIGFEEHPDSVDFQNIASTNLKKAFQLSTSSITGGAATQIAHNFDYGLTLRVFAKGSGRNNSKTFDLADELIDDIFQALLPASVRLGTVIKDIVPDSVSKNPLSGSNDYDVEIEISFTVKLLNCYNGTP